LLAQGLAGYSTREVSEVLGLPASTILSWSRSGLLTPQRDPRGAYVFSFQDIAVLRAARELLDAEVPARRIRQTLEALRSQLPPGRPLSAVHLSAVGSRVLVREENRAWEADTGQLEMALEAAEPTSPPEGNDVAPLRPTRDTGHADADRWFDRALDLEATDPEAAADLYRQALQVEPGHAEAHLNLGRLLHEAGELAPAEAHYRASLASDPGSARAAYNLGVALEDGGNPEEAADAYRAALDLDPALAVAHFNLSRLHEAAGRPAEALQHLASYKRILDRVAPGD